MFNRTVKRSLQGATLASLILTGIGSCSSNDQGPATGSTTSTAGAGGGASTTTSTTSTGTASTTTAGGSSASTTSTTSTTSGGGQATGSNGGSGGGSGGQAGAAGSGGSGGSQGREDGGMAGSPKDGGSDAPSTEGGAMCTPMGPPPNGTTGYVRTGWGGQWTPACNFKSGNGQCSDLPPMNAFDGKANRTSLGDTHVQAGGSTAQAIGDTFTFDMQSCHSVSQVWFYCGEPPSNSVFDPRDFPGALEVSVSSDCTTAANGDITGTFVPFTPAVVGNEPLGTNGQGCSRSSCTGPFTISFPAGTAARCIRMRLTKILAAGGGIWWAMDELYVK